MVVIAARRAHQNVGELLVDSLEMSSLPLAPTSSYDNLEYANAEYYDMPPNMVKAIFSKDHRYTVEQLKKARREAGLNQAEVARVLNKTQSHVSKVEAGQRRIDIVMLKEFAQIYKKSLDYFLKP